MFLLYHSEGCNIFGLVCRVTTPPLASVATTGAITITSVRGVVVSVEGVIAGGGTLQGSLVPHMGGVLRAKLHVE
jgi:hypothetical protein